MPRSKSAKDKELENNARLLRVWRKGHAEQLVEALAGAHHAVLTRMMAQLENLKSARELVDAITAEDWSVVDADTRFICLHEINTAICRLRERNGLVVIDDPLPGELDNAYRIIKAMFDKFPAPAGRRAGVSGKSVE
jgi:hypothetical protein